MTMAADLRSKLTAAADGLAQKRDKLEVLRQRLAAEGVTLHESSAQCKAQVSLCQWSSVFWQQACFAATCGDQGLAA